ncbi:MAG: hypothetical protein OES24_00100 [Acidimicrobiia bacterium]|nr:hypothetical protein [Acidimicrobiia bacterium]
MPRSSKTVVSRTLLSLTLLTLMSCVGLAQAAAAQAADQAADQAGSPAGPDREIVTGRRQLAVAEVRAAAVDSRAASNEMGRSMQTFRFGDYEISVSAGSPLEVFVGQAADGSTVYEAVPSTFAAGVPQETGYVTPTDGYYKYNNEGSGTETVGTWNRKWWWTLNKANDFATSSTTKHDYYRTYVQIQGAALTGSSANEGYRQLWIELDWKSSTLIPALQEVGMPKESYAGVPNQTTTIGFSTSASIKLGAPPVEGTLGAETDWQGSMTRSTENWHPIIRSEKGSGGVMWCRYEAAEFTGTKYLTARVSTRIGSTASFPGQSILRGQRENYSSCPTQI